ncbi:cytochrome b [Pseudorhodobacter sp. W20_MBD10_FR17]|uniref:cytochrome b n=1 Tax=Pseudorhodobacter sp. W20_MBD10_FR17 TaxID=3240266 RepID=UPI003F9640FD
MTPDAPPPTATYRTTAKVLHWLVAGLVVLMIPIGQVMVMEGLPRLVQNTLFLLHKNGGLIVGLLMLLRLTFRLRYPPPPLPVTMRPFQARLASLTHALLYGLVFTMAVSGYLRVVAGGYPIEGLDILSLPQLIGRSPVIEKAAQAVHYYAHFAVIILVAAHIGAALYHALWLRDGVMARMWPIGRR